MKNEKSNLHAFNLPQMPYFCKMKHAHVDFEAIDQLSMAKTPFYFAIDFLMQNLILVPESAYEASGLQMHLPGKNSDFNPINKPLQLKSNPETQASYQKGFDLVMAGLKRGDSYLLNYTRCTPISCNYHLPEIYAASQAKYKLLYQDDFVCFSPETFVQIQDNRISTEPMKGTINANLPNAHAQLRQNPKEIAEHHTVVDLLRNDLSMVANRVAVKALMRIDRIATHGEDLLGMSSEITGELKPQFQGKIGSVLRKLLPAGSILGAPKPKTLALILAAENYPRGFYTGVAGYFDGQNLDSFVMIRFIEKKDEQLYFKSGGGITHNSQLAHEYNEMIEKIYVPIY
jgi:para-aminobenzoate synthetase component I